MNRLPETVTRKFNELFAVMGQATDDLKLTIADASMAGNFGLVTANIKHCQRLQSLEDAIKSCVNNFEAESETLLQEKSRHKRNKNRTRKPRGSMRVNLAGKVVEKSTIAETFFEALKVFGLDRVAQLNKVVTSIPLISRKPATGYQTQRTYNGWYITTHVNAYTAPTVLKEIAHELKMPVQIEFIER